jgi:hypothetical protein
MKVVMKNPLKNHPERMSVRPKFYSKMTSTASTQENL